jgi:hypothetical protein
MLLKVDAHEELIMVLLQRGSVIAALKYVRERSIIAPAASFLKAAKATGNDCMTSPLHACLARRQRANACRSYFLRHLQVL